MLVKIPFVAADFIHASEAIQAFLNYRPGTWEPSIRECASRRARSLTQLQAMIHDFDDTTDASSSEAAVTENEQLSDGDQAYYATLQAHYIKYRKNQKMRLIAARGVHFLPHFSSETRQAIQETRQLAHPTYSQSTRYDVGYDGDVEPDETADRIVRRHRFNMQFLDKLKTEADKKEKASKKTRPAASRNAIQFSSLYWRFIQAYINSYSFMFSDASIQTNFGFDTTHNPLVSLSYDPVKAMMYGSGLRFSQEGPNKRRDPHYRRSTGKPKHPNLGYVDIFVFDIDYVNTHGVDRLLAYNKGFIKLSNLYLSEAELILPSMIPKQYHLKRRMIVVPSFAGNYSAATLEPLGIATRGAFTRFQTKLSQLAPGRGKDSDYATWLERVTTHVVEQQAQLLENAVQATIFRQKLVHGCNHDGKFGASLPSPKKK